MEKERRERQEKREERQNDSVRGELSKRSWKSRKLNLATSRLQQSPEIAAPHIATHTREHRILGVASAYIIDSHFESALALKNLTRHEEKEMGDHTVSFFFLCLALSLSRSLLLPPFFPSLFLSLSLSSRHHAERRW